MKKRKRIILALAAVALLLLGGTAFDNGLTVRHYAIQSDKVDEEITLVLITDLHSTIHRNNQQSLIELIEKQKPDVILLAGDIADDEVPILGTSMLLQGIGGLCPAYYVTGNHEYRSRRVGAVRAEIESYGVTILADESVMAEIGGTPLIIGGVEDPDKRIYEEPGYNHFAAMEQAFGTLERDETFKILLAHRPENIEEYVKYPFDLVVSGHAHGGQVRIPFLLNGLFAPNQGWFPPYAGGAYIHGETMHIVSRGLSISPLLPRVFNSPELVVIALEPRK